MKLRLLNNYFYNEFDSLFLSHYTLLRLGASCLKLRGISKGPRRFFQENVSISKKKNLNRVGLCGNVPKLLAALSRWIAM